MIRIRHVRSSELALLPGIERSAGERFRSVGLDSVADGDDLPIDFHRRRAAEGLVWVAEQDDVLLGYVTCEACADALHVWSLDVRIEAQGRGVGRTLLQTAVREAERRRLPAVTLTTFRDVAWNAPFYLRRGFRVLDTHEAGERLARIRQLEACHGLDVQPRCAMRLALTTRAELARRHTRLFATRELAARIDRAEARLTASVARAQRERDSFVRDVAGGIAAFTAPSSPLNKLIGLGYDGVPDDEQLDAIEQLFSTLGEPLQAELSTLADPAVAAQLIGRGYVLEGFENVLGCRIDDACAEGSVPDTLCIELLDDRDADRWLDVTVDGVLDADDGDASPSELPAHTQLRPLLSQFTSAPGIVRYGAWIDGELAGTASMRIDGTLAQLCGATTLSRYRRRGIQTALLQRRLDDARRQGCELAVMTTQPGSRSQANGERQGFGLLYARALLVKRFSRNTKSAKTPAWDLHCSHARPSTS